jgi:hypothetical protein
MRRAVTTMPAIANASGAACVTQSYAGKTWEFDLSERYEIVNLRCK